MPFCDQCGAENPDWARFCDQCGNPLTVIPQASAPPAPAPGPGETVPSAPAAANQCAQCGSQVLPGEAFCDNCGAPLTPLDVAGRPTAGAPGGAAIPPQQNYPAPQPFQVPPAPAAPATPEPTAQSAPAAPQRLSLSMVHLHVPGRNAALSLPATSEVLVGRSDAVSGVYPDIDLTPYEGIEKGVGRRHLLMSINDQGQVVIEDLNSTNGTYLNNQRLSPQQPQPIADGDEIRLGKLVLRVQL